jgi:hypothetical protein
MGLLALAATAHSDQPATPRSASARFAPIKVTKAQPAVTCIALLDADQVRDEVTDNELVLGVEYNGVARAYPINMVGTPQREIINDTLAGQPVAVTWCCFCHNGVVYLRNVGGQTLTFAVSGQLWKRSMVMLDEETGSLWSHILGEAMEGWLLGTRLEAIPCEVITWGAWREAHPRTTVVNFPREVQRYTDTFYKKPQDYVLGVVRDGEAASVTFAAMLKRPVLNCTIGGQDLVVSFHEQSASARIFSRKAGKIALNFTPSGSRTMIDLQTRSTWDRVTGVCTQGALMGSLLAHEVGIVSERVAWEEFHPQSKPLAH